MNRSNKHIPLPRQPQAIRVPALPYRHRGMARMPARPWDRLSRATFRTWRALRVGIEADFRLAVLLMCGALSLLTITPFAVYRFLQGQTTAGVIDLALILVIGLANAHAWRSKRSRGAAQLMVVINTLGCIAVTPLIGINGMFWAYTTILMTFFLVDRKEALLANAVLIGGVALLPNPALMPTQVMGFVATASLVALYAWVFSTRADRQHLHLQGLAQQDPLTGAGNRRLMELELAQAVKRDQPAATAAVVVLDLDHFKRVNDEHGHAAGDVAICDFADVVRSAVRRSDRLYRFGGEEFVLLLSEVDGKGLAPALAKILALVRERMRGPGGPITASIGAALIQPGERWQDWLARADDALYSAKRNGRDRIVIAGDDSGGTPTLLVSPADGEAPAPERETTADVALSANDSAAIRAAA